ncbi:hypothetical protein GCM10010170_062560 [Dactylosporangium salmoneum]|uniref:Uncharacterized protein n=1 Tax=Dactylosporangium salmoneum TaxID=53361 RepID=A0ABN3H0B5_9ACTN
MPASSASFVPLGTPTLAGVGRVPAAVLPELGGFAVFVLAGFELGAPDGDAEAWAEAGAEPDGSTDGSGWPLALPRPD